MLKNKIYESHNILSNLQKKIADLTFISVITAYFFMKFLNFIIL